ncbi:EF-Hand 1, calcium-binding site [Ostreococcus tauri]|uniref:EF-Hand 1, calcium-binding site n=1 Tax=Ostreococcus tauri TaxID=70448 RepID=A0A090M054_OSTTA|nr:EF-Hand 1, calcium-binding site [Ostreococcus tauri]CEF97645.1 EF-Hand 1, calcium-binding site [Ostreococcus tauri]|eukprot:XP_003078879.2 EF-Hand 1, calcium-binding site [Ostreococcus tauri]
MTRVLQTSLSPRAARLIAKGFVDLGIKEPGDLRAVVAKRSLGMIGIELAAAIFNVALCMSLFSLAVIVHYSGYEILLPTFLNYVAGFCVLVGAAIFAVEAAAHLIILGVYVYSTVRFETSNLKKFVSAVRRIGDEDHVVGGFTQPLSSLKRATTLVHVVNILTQLRDALHSEAELIDLKHKGTLHNLAAYFEYSNAQSKYGFKPEDYGIEPKEAMSLAALFSEWDTDGSGTLSSTELKYLLNALGHDTVNEMEVNMAMRVLDKDETGEVNFSEFVRWYREGVTLPMASKLESNANESDDLQNADPGSSIDEPSS